MSTENPSSESTTETTETVDPTTETTAPAETAGAETPGTETATPDEQGTQQPDPAKASLLADLHKERSDRKSAQARVTELETRIAELESVQETLDAVQSKYNRLEQFLAEVGGPLSRALDSRSFTTALFETDADIKDIVAKWHRDNPTATSEALGGGIGPRTSQTPTMSDLIRAASK